MLADVVVSASTDPEAFGRVVTEAQAMGRPVLATDHGAAQETVSPGETGWLTPPGNSKRLAEALSWALELEPKARNHLAAKARARIVQRYSNETMCKATIGVYREVLAGDPIS